MQKYVNRINAKIITIHTLRYEKIETYRTNI